jgi:dTDP-4-amino-4,6-dideoxygalactose transaminase
VDERVFGADRDEIFAALDAQGIGARKYFYPLVNDFGCYRDRYSSDDTPVARAVSSRVLTLPLYPELPLREAARICDIILSCGKNAKR